MPTNIILAVCFTALSACTSAPIASDEVLAHYFKLYEVKYNLPPNLLREVARVESGFDQDVIFCKKEGKVGELGIMQIRPEFHPEAGNPCDPKDAIAYAGKWLSELHRRFGSWYEALAAYNWGPTNLSKYGVEKIPDSTRNYIRKVLSNTIVKQI